MNGVGLSSTPVYVSGVVSYPEPTGVLSYDLILWDEENVGLSLDSFQDWGDFNAIYTVVEGDYARLISEGSVGYIYKEGLNVDVTTYPYLYIALWGTGNYFVYVKDFDDSWNLVKANTAAPSTYDLVKIDLDLAGITTVKGIRLGITAATGTYVTYDFAEMHSEDFLEPTDLMEAMVHQREYSADLLALKADMPTFYPVDHASRVYQRGRNIRLIMGRGTNKEKIFAGVIEETAPREKTIDVVARDYNHLFMTETYSVDYDDANIETAVEDIASRIQGITTARVVSPSPTITVKKSYQEVHLSDMLDQLASIATKQSPYYEYRWKIGYGKDLRFRPYNDEGVRTCSTVLTEESTLLVGPKKGMDMYELGNKVVAISGLIKNPEDDAYCESATGWTADNCTIGTSSTILTTGIYGLHIDAPVWYNDHSISRNILEIDLTEFARFVFDMRYGEDMTGGTIYFAVRLYTSAGNFFQYRVLQNSSTERELQFLRYEINLDNPMWTETGSPDWSSINKIELHYINAKSWTGSWDVDNIHFEADNVKREEYVSGTPLDNYRTLVYKDEAISTVEQLEDLAVGLAKVVGGISERIMLPSIGVPDLQSGRRVLVICDTYSLNGSYYIAEAVHHIGKGYGYQVHVTLTTRNLALPVELFKTILSDLRRETQGSVKLL